MNINQTETAVASYCQSMISGVIPTINELVFDFIKRNGPASRNEIQRGLNLTARQAGCSVWHLTQNGKIRLTGGTVIDKLTLREVETVEINREPEILFKKVSNSEKLKLISDFCKENTDSWVSDAILAILNK